MDANTLCKLLPHVAAPLCRILLDPAAALVLLSLKPCKLAMLPLFAPPHRDDMLAIMEALSVDMAGRALPEAVALIPADTLHELTALIAGICEVEQ